LAAGADLILLDNFPLEQIRAAVQRVGGKVPLEASGNMNLERARKAAEAGVDYISVGALTHSAKALDLSLLVVRP
jgi:nicotinate-nucleotide pyrophosphorylase (carboxylating)